MSVTPKPFYIKLLLAEIEKRKEKNPRYSLRAFARYLGMGPSTLSRILSNRQELSHSACKTIIKKLKFNRDDCVLFISSIAEERKRKAYKLLYSIIEDSTGENETDSFQWMLSNTPDMMFVFDTQGRCIHASEPASQFFNIEQEEMIGKTMDEIGMHEDIAEEIRKCLESVFHNPRVEKVEECYETNGDTRCFEITLVPVGHSSSLKAVACHWRDITERIMTERLWKISITIGEIISSNSDIKKSLPIIAEELTERYAESCIIKIAGSKKIITSGKKNLVQEHQQKISRIDQSEIHAEKKILTIPFNSGEKVSSIISLMREKERSDFSLKDLELARDIQNRLQSCS